MAEIVARDPVKVTKEMVKQVMVAMGSKGGKRSLETMTPQERIARAKKASDAAAKVRTAKRLAAERARKSAKKRT